MRLRADQFTLDVRGGLLTLHAWDGNHNLVRRIASIDSRTRSRMVLRTEKFGKKTGALTLLDLRRSDPYMETRRSARWEFREVFRRFLSREFPDYRIAELSTEANLERSLSPAYPRALIERGSSAMAAVAARPDSPADGALTFGLIWLDYLRRRDRGKGKPVAGLVILLPAGQENNTCLRLRYLDPGVARYSLFVYSEDERAAAVDPDDRGNVDTHLEHCRRPVEGGAGWLEDVSGVEGVETVVQASGAVSYRVHGLEFAKLQDGRVQGGIEKKRPIQVPQSRELENLARELARVRSADGHPRHPLASRNREAWLESQVRAHLEEIDPTLWPEPLYGQVPAFSGGERGVLDLLGVDRDGRLAVIELKASEDVHLPLQALDYWVRVNWHLERGEFSKFGYFPGMELRRVPPRLLLVAPALDFHPSNERILKFFSPRVAVERLGLNGDWQRRPRLMFRMT